MSMPVTMRSGGPASWVVRLALFAVLVLVVLYIPTRMSNSFITQATDALVLMAAAMALNLLLGFTGQLSIGHSAFFGIGAYTTAICVTRYGWSPTVTFPMAFVIAFVIGMVVSLPALRIKGVYLALVTLALGLNFPRILKWRKLTWLTGGPRGLDGTGYNFGRQNRTYEIFGWNPFGDLRGEGSKPFYYWLAVVVVVVVYLICRGVVKSRAGRSLVAIRDNETAAAVMGVNLAVTKALVFGLSAALCSLPGSVSAIRTGNVIPDTQLLSIVGAIIFLIIMVIGGAGSLWGPIIGAVLYVFITNKTGEWTNDESIPWLLRPLFSWSKVPPGTGIFAVALIVLMFVAPHGLVGLGKQLLARFVRVLPSPAGTATVDSSAVITEDDEDRLAGSAS